MTRTGLLQRSTHLILAGDINETEGTPEDKLLPARVGPCTLCRIGVMASTSAFQAEDDGSNPLYGSIEDVQSIGSLPLLRRGLKCGSIPPMKSW